MPSIRSSVTLFTGSLAVLGHGQSVPGPTAIAPRATRNHAAQVECVSNILGDSILMPDPSNKVISESALAVEVCQATLPGSLSSEYSSYREELTRWAEDLKDAIAELTSCGIDSTTIPLAVGERCPTGVVVFYTQNSETITSSYGVLPNPTEIVLPVPEETKTGMASRIVGFYSSWVVLAILLVENAM